MKCIKTEAAVGHVLCHDITEIIPGKTKGPAFRKGHIVREEDIPKLLSLGKENLYVWERGENMLHEDEGAAILRDLCMGDGSSKNNPIMKATEPKEGKIEIKTSIEGLFKVDSQRLKAINSLGEMIIATRHGGFAVSKGDVLCAMRVIPLVIEKGKLELAKKVAGDEPLLQVLPFQKKKAGIVVTGSEVAKGRIEDSFGPVVEAKLRLLGAEIIGKRIVTDSQEEIVMALTDLADQGADLLLCTGGMSVDPDDKTPGAIKSLGARIVSYGAPVLPGAMFLLAYYDREGKTIPVMGLPGCVMYAGRTIFDLVLPRIMAGDQVEREDLVKYGEGGLCLGCEACTFPNCGFGK